MFKKLITSFCVCILLAGCGQQAVDNSAASGPLVLDDTLLQVVTVDTVKSLPLQDELLLNGRVTFDPGQVVPVYPIFGGRVTQVKAEIGDYVQKGQLLAVIRSAEVAELEKEKKEALHQLNLARRNRDVVEDLWTSGMASEPDRLTAIQELAAAEAEVKRIEEFYRIHDISEDASWSVLSPVSGFIVEKNISRDMQIRGDWEEALFTVSGLEEVWVIADVYESDISKVSTGAGVRITTLAYKDREFRGVVDKVSPMLDDESKTMSIRVRLPNKDYLLKPGLFTNVYVSQRVEEKYMSCIPSRAILFEDGHHYVVKVGANDLLQLQEIDIYLQTEHNSFIRSGLDTGEKIILQNAILIFNAIR